VPNRHRSGSPAGPHFDEGLGFLELGTGREFAEESIANLAEVLDADFTSEKAVGSVPRERGEEIRYRPEPRIFPYALNDRRPDLGLLSIVLDWHGR
jgi:hypothetical protein